MPLTLSTDTIGPLAAAAQQAAVALRSADVAARIARRDHTVWKPQPTEISNRMGWMDSPTTMAPQLASIESLVDDVRSAGFTQALLLGMGGSSLAPEVFRRLFGVADGYLDVAVLDSTDPGAVARRTANLDLSRTLFVPATKSGGTVETLSFTKYCYRLVADALGAGAEPGRQFVAITDPGSGLADLAQELGFRQVLLNDPDIGGRYSALSHFGILPARLGGVDVARLLDSGSHALADASDESIGLRLGGILAAQPQRDKLTLLASPSLAPLGVWVEQLVAESTGKEGRGILPVDSEPLGDPQVYGEDRLFVAMSVGDEVVEGAAALAEAGHPVVHLRLDDLYDVGGCMVIWEMATIVASHLLQINPFDQPDVEAAKILARSMMDTYQRDGSLPQPTQIVHDQGVTVFGGGPADSLAQALRNFFADPPSGAYLSLQAYIPPTEPSDTALAHIRQTVRDVLRWATTAGYGPRYLHSTGQLHKGDGGHGLFLQITCDDAQDLTIPDSPDATQGTVTFGTLKAAQALGDSQALIDGRRRVLRLHIGADVDAGLQTIVSAIQQTVSTPDQPAH